VITITATALSGCGSGVDDAPATVRNLESYRANRRRDFDDFARQHFPIDLAMPQSDRRRLAENHVRQLRPLFRRRNHGQQGPGPIFLHLDRHVKHFQRTGRVQPIHGDAENLRVHVVDFAFNDRHPFAR